MQYPLPHLFGGKISSHLTLPLKICHTLPPCPAILKVFTTTEFSQQISFDTTKDYAIAGAVTP